MSAEIITIGTELLHGLVRNTNADRIVDLLAEVGVEAILQTTVGDDTGRLSENEIYSWNAVVGLQFEY